MDHMRLENQMQNKNWKDKKCQIRGGALTLILKINLKKQI